MDTWYFLSDGGEKGPFTLEELGRQPKLTPDVWVRRADESSWRRARDIPELQELFLDKLPPTDPKSYPQPEEGHELTLDAGGADPRLFLLLLLILISLLYACHHLWFP